LADTGRIGDEPLKRTAEAIAGMAAEAKRNGARLVCIDPRRSETAEKCHEHVQLLPGTDAALALALMHELIANDWLDHDYLARHTVGWPALRERALGALRG